MSEIILRFVVQLLFVFWLIYTSYITYSIFRSDKYLKVKEMERQVRLSKLDLKQNMKLAIIDYKKYKKRDDRKVFVDNFICSDITDIEESLYNNYIKSGGNKNIKSFIEWLYRLNLAKIEKFEDEALREEVMK